MKEAQHHAVLWVFHMRSKPSSNCVQCRVARTCYWAASGGYSFFSKKRDLTILLGSRHVLPKRPPDLQPRASSFSLEQGWGCTQQVGSSGSLQEQKAFASVSPCLGASDVLCAGWGPCISSAQLQSLLEGTVCPWLLHRAQVLTHGFGRWTPPLHIL